MSETKKKPEKENIKVEDFYQMKQVGEIAFQPGSSDVYYTITQANKDDNGYRTSVWRYREQAMQFSQGLPSDRMIKWSPDGKFMGA